MAVGREVLGASLNPQERESQSTRKAGDGEGLIKLFLELREPHLLGERYCWPAHRAKELCDASPHCGLGTHFGALETF